MVSDLFQEWRSADRAAVLAERAVLMASMAAIEGRGDYPSAEQIAASKRMRGLANDLFEVAMADFAEKAANLRR